MYEKPTVIENGVMEGVYADSGDLGGWNGSITWESHDSGQFSVIRIIVNSLNPGTYNNIAVTIQYNGPGNITDIVGSTNPCYWSGTNQVTLTRNGFLNAYQNGIDCGGIQFKFDTPQYEAYQDGAEWKGIPPCSFYKSGEHIGEPAPFSIISISGS